MQCLYCFFIIRNKQKIDFIQLKHFSPTCQIAAICYYHIIKLFVFCLCSLFHHSTIKETQLQHFLIITIYFFNNNFFSYNFGLNFILSFWMCLSTRNIWSWYFSLWRCKQHHFTRYRYIWKCLERKKINQVLQWYNVWVCGSKEISILLKAAVLISIVCDVFYDGICEMDHENV